MSPGECIVHDMGSEFCNNLQKQLHECFGVDVRITSAGRPQPNGQAESSIRNVKAKLEAFMFDIGNAFSASVHISPRALLHHTFPVPRITSA